MLRDYQQNAINMLYEWFRNNQSGNVCVVLPTGSGKSHVVAALCKDALQSWPETRVLMLTHQAELIEQNAEKMLLHWPNAPMGIYSASLGRRDLSQPITFAGIGSVRTRAREIGHIDLVLVDECFVAGTKILTPSGEKDIDKVRCGDIVYNLSGCGVVEAVSCKPAPETYTLELSNGRSIECTPNHPFLTSEGWKRAEKLENGSSLYGIQAVYGLWSRVQTLDKTRREREGDISTTRAFMEEAELLLNQVCKEIQPNGIGCSSQEKDQRYTEKDKASAYKAWRKRAIASLASACASSCSWGWLGCGASDKNKCWTPERCVSECLQSGYSEPRKNDSDRAGRKWSRVSCETIARSKENGSAGIVRVVSVSSNKRKGATPVYNLQVSGHPSYFANGVAVHNCHMINNKESGNYRALLAQLTEINPRLRVIGLTATPYRLGQGYVTDGEQALFKALIEPVTISHLINVGHLCELRSKSTDVHYDVSGVRTRAGEFVEKDLQEAVSDELTNREAVQEIVARAGDRKSWIIFCTGVDHAKQVAEYLQDLGVTAACVTGETPKKERADILAGFKNGSIKAVTNCNVLTTGFDHTGIDLVALMRPTQSPGLYVQMVGRGLRVNGIKKDALVLDFAENIARHGPITNVNPPRKPGEKGGGVAPVKECPECAELVHTSIKLCPECGYVWPEPERRYTLASDDIMGRIPTALTMDVASWKWEKHTSRSSGRDMLKVTYYGHALSDKPVTEYICLGYEGWAGRKAHETIVSILRNSIPEGVERFAGEQNAEELERLLFSVVDNRGAERFEDISALMNEYATSPFKIDYIIDGKYPQIKERIWQ